MMWIADYCYVLGGKLERFDCGCAQDSVSIYQSVDSVQSIYTRCIGLLSVA